MKNKNDWWGPVHWPEPRRKKESWEVLTLEQIARYDKELASENWKKYSIIDKVYGEVQKRD